MPRLRFDFYSKQSSVGHYAQNVGDTFDFVRRVVFAEYFTRRVPSSLTLIDPAKNALE